MGKEESALASVCGPRRSTGAWPMAIFQFGAFVGPRGPRRAGEALSGRQGDERLHPAHEFIGPHGAAVIFAGWESSGIPAGQLCAWDVRDLGKTSRWGRTGSAYEQRRRLRSNLVAGWPARGVLAIFG